MSRPVLSGDDHGLWVGGRRLAWQAETDVVVVGFGAAGAATAIEASEHGARVPDDLAVVSFDNLLPELPLLLADRRRSQHFHRR